MQIKKWKTAIHDFSSKFNPIIASCRENVLLVCVEAFFEEWGSIPTRQELLYKRKYTKWYWMSGIPRGYAFVYIRKMQECKQANKAVHSWSDTLHSVLIFYFKKAFSHINQWTFVKIFYIQKNRALTTKNISLQK